MKIQYILWLLIALTLSLFLPTSQIEADTELPLNKIILSVDHDNNLIKGRAFITMPKNREMVVDLGLLKVNSLLYNNTPLIGKENKKSIRLEASDTEATLEVVYELTPDETGSGGVASSSSGMFFSDGWFPKPRGLTLYKLNVTVSDGYEALSEAQEIVVRKEGSRKDYSFIFEHPLRGISLIVGKYKVFQDRQGNIDLYTYFFEDDSVLRETLFTLTKKYLAHYEKRFGPYPYKRFSIVENFLPTGYAMPTYTLIGQTVIRLPHYVVESFLSHEILHQWFGCSVYVKYVDGNWSEGLVTYLADYYQYEKKGTAHEYRKQALLNSYFYIPESERMSLREFRTRHDRMTKAIGYDRAMMFFSMLNTQVGNESFYKSLKRIAQEYRFRKISWTDMGKVFEEESGKELDQFFDQWTDVTTLPQLTVEDVAIIEEKEGTALTFRIIQIQKGKPLTFDLPVRIKTMGGDVTQTLLVDKEKNYFKVSLPDMPEEIILDEKYTVLRGLVPEETNPIIAGLLADKERIIVTPQKDKNKYKDLIEFYKKRDFKEVAEKDFKFEDTKESSLLILGFDSPIVKKILGRVLRGEGDFVFKVFKNPFNPHKVIAVAEGETKEDLHSGGARIFHYGNYSTLRFVQSRLSEKSVTKAHNGIILPVMRPEMAIELSSSLDLDYVVQKVSDKKVIYIGETHNRYEHHIAQLRIIKKLYKRGVKIAIGMEMFVPSQQKYLDKFMEGKIDEKEFLISSNYFEHWGMDYSLYRGILEFARNHQIPVVGLNINTKIVKKVSSSGISSLTDSEKRELPHYIDLTDSEYKKRLESPFTMHKGFEDKKFHDFFKAQVIRDEAMAQGIAHFLSDNSSYKMVVIAGTGHIVHDSGIPKRAYRLTAQPYATIINASGEDIEQESADFVIFPSPLEAPLAPKLMVMIKEKKGVVEIVDFPKNSVSEAAGLKKGDIIRTLDGTAIKNTQDIKVFLFFKKKGDSVKVRVKRKKLILEEEHLDFNVIL